MRRLFLASVLLVLLTNTVQAQNCAGRFLLETQQQVDTFACTIVGNLTVSGATIVNLDGLSSLTSVGGSLIIGANAALADVAGLSSLTSVGETLLISGNAVLPNVDGLSSLTSVNGRLSVTDNAALANVDGLSSLTSVGGDLSVQINAALVNMDGLSSLTSIGGDLYIEVNAVLTNVDGLSSLTSVGDMLLILNNATLANVDGLSSLTSVGGNLFVGANPELANMDGFSSLKNVGGFLYIQLNSALANVDGLSSLTKVGGDFNISSNDVLANLDGLSSLTSVDNGSAEEIALHVYGNMLLARCSTGLGPVLTLDAADESVVSGTISFDQNEASGDCNSVDDVLEAFSMITSADDGSVLLSAPLSVAPNPASASARLTFELGQATDARVALYDLLGRQLAILADGPMQGRVEVPVDTAALPAGLYVVRLVSGERVETVRLSVVR